MTVVLAFLFIALGVCIGRLVDPVLYFVREIRDARKGGSRS